ncbi:hypothetical protein B0T22DRAFT_447198 [Podospora appendiculata]|uniref:Uncharacterized protein n=1 Tax=Podospora appendiculata TaxID=314037 RepID=A0AAE0XFG4_9PEZI|nr:hypothetical protein B0T22DRAFT_447198 [Podospora appendiculata]
MSVVSGGPNRHSGRTIDWTHVSMQPEAPLPPSPNALRRILRRTGFEDGRGACCFKTLAGPVLMQSRHPFPQEGRADETDGRGQNHGWKHRELDTWQEEYDRYLGQVCTVYCGSVSWPRTSTSTSFQMYMFVSAAWPSPSSTKAAPYFIRIYKDRTERGFEEKATAAWHSCCPFSQISDLPYVTQQSNHMDVLTTHACQYSIQLVSDRGDTMEYNVEKGVGLILVNLVAEGSPSQNSQQEACPCVTAENKSLSDPRIRDMEKNEK